MWLKNFTQKRQQKNINPQNIYNPYLLSPKVLDKDPAKDCKEPKRKMKIKQ